MKTFSPSIPRLYKSEKVLGIQAKVSVLKTKSQNNLECVSESKIGSFEII